MRRVGLVLLAAVRVGLRLWQSYGGGVRPPAQAASLSADPAPEPGGHAGGPA